MPGCLYGTGNEQRWLNIAMFYDGFPQWRDKRWIPVAGDGAGNTYVIDNHLPGAPVAFVEPMDSPNVLQFYVASEYLIFLRELLQDSISGTGWPFDADYVARVDPGIAELSPLPWGSLSARLRPDGLAVGDGEAHHGQSMVWLFNAVRVPQLQRRATELVQLRSLAWRGLLGRPSRVSLLQHATALSRWVLMG